jgi:hypothetical protein
MPHVHSGPGRLAALRLPLQQPAEPYGCLMATSSAGGSMVRFTPRAIT